MIRWIVGKEYSVLAYDFRLESLDMVEGQGKGF